MCYQETTGINPDFYFIILRTGIGNKNIIKFPVFGLTNSKQYMYITVILYSIFIPTWSSRLWK